MAAALMKHSPHASSYGDSAGNGTVADYWLVLNSRYRDLWSLLILENLAAAQRLMHNATESSLLIANRPTRVWCSLYLNRRSLKFNFCTIPIVNSHRMFILASRQWACKVVTLGSGLGSWDTWKGEWSFLVSDLVPLVNFIVPHSLSRSSAFSHPSRSIHSRWWWGIQVNTYSISDIVWKINIAMAVYVWSEQWSACNKTLNSGLNCIFWCNPSVSGCSLTKKEFSYFIK